MKLSRGPSLDEKLRFHRMRMDGLCDTWAAYLKLKEREKAEESAPDEDLKLKDHKPGQNVPRTDPNEDLGF